VIVLGLLAIGFLAVLVFGLGTGRIDWRQQGCCAPADPADDLRMRDPETTSGSAGTTRREEP
jgi:hypothetical protein